MANHRKTTPTPEQAKRVNKLFERLCARATSQAALAKALSCSATQIGIMLRQSRVFSYEMQQSVAAYLGIHPDVVEGYYLNNEPVLEDLITAPKLEGLVDAQVAIEFLESAPPIVRIEAGLRLLNSGLHERDGLHVNALRPIYEAFTTAFAAAVAASPAKRSSQARALLISEQRLEELTSGAKGPTLEELTRIAARYPDDTGELENAEYWRNLAFPNQPQLSALPSFDRHLSAV